jgi:hypothetical protein
VLRLARAGFLALALAAPAPAAELKPDEELLFFPTYAWRSPDGSGWTAELHAWVFEPERDSVKRGFLLDRLENALGLSKGASESGIFRERAAAFIADNERGKRIRVRLGDRLFDLGKTGADGHVRSRLGLRTPPGAGPWVEYLEEGAEFAGRVQLLEPEGVLVVSDIDDTIKVSRVRDRRALLEHTFLKPFEAVEGMPELYRSWAARGAAFHYVSASPWQLYSPIAGFLRAAGYPEGSFHMKRFRWKDRAVLDLFGGQEDYKRKAIEPVLRAFPRRRFLLVGDSGEQDPEIFGALARDFPAQISAVYIRDVSGEPASAPRYGKAFAGVPAERWRVFSSASELADSIW